MLLTPCLHCQTRRGLRDCRGLCYGCYHAPGVRERYPRNPKYGPKADGDCAATLAPRRAWESRWWCLWCFRWRCDDPMRLCAECEADYHRRAVGMMEEEGETATCRLKLVERMEVANV